MKKTLNFLIVSLIVVITSCSKAPEKLIVGKWRFSDVDISTLNNAKNLSAKEKQDLEKMKTILRKVTMEYLADNTFKANLPDELRQSSKNGTYKLEEDGKFIITEQVGVDGVKKSERSEIEKLTEDILILKSEKGGSASFVRE